MNIKYIAVLFEQLQIVQLQRKSDFFMYRSNSIAFSIQFFFSNLLSKLLPRANEIGSQKQLNL